MRDQMSFRKLFERHGVIKAIAGFFLVLLVGALFSTMWRGELFSNSTESVKIFQELSLASSDALFGSNEIRKLGKKYGLKFSSYHQRWKPSQLDIGRNVMMFEGGDFYRYSPTGDPNNYRPFDLNGFKPYKSMGVYRVFNESVEGGEWHTGLLSEVRDDSLYVAIHPVGHIVIDFRERTLFLFTSDYWDEENESIGRLIENGAVFRCKFLRGKPVLPPCD